MFFLDLLTLARLGGSMDMSCLHGGLAVWVLTAATSLFVLLMLCPSLLCPFLFHLTFAVPLLQASYDLSLCFPSSQEWQERTPACFQPVGGRQSRRPLGLVLRPTAATATHAQSNQAGLFRSPHGPTIFLPHVTGSA